MTTRTLTCISCPLGCQITVEMEGKEILKIEGNTCKRGYEYAKNECTHPVRTLTSTVALEGGGVLPVKTDKPIPKELLFDAMEVLNHITARANVKLGDIILPNLLGTDANVIATRNA